MNAEFIDLCLQERTLDDADFALNEGYYEEIKQHAQKLGLHGQIDLADECLRKHRRPEILTPCISRQELLIWKAFLPTSYRDNVSKLNSDSRCLNSYRFDLMPKHVFERWVEWNNSLVFDEFEIRTEEELLDPALFGIRGGKYWLLARWVASDEELISFEEIKRFLRERLIYDRRCMTGAACFFLAASLLFLWPVINVLRGVESLGMLGALAPAIFSLLIALVIWMERDQKLWSALCEHK